MKHSALSLIRKHWAWFAALTVVALVWPCSRALAPPRAPRRAIGARKVGRAHVKRTQARKHLARRARRHRYWHARYRSRSSTWNRIHYRYYIGGTDYVVVDTPTEVTSDTAQPTGGTTVTSAETTSDAQLRYMQMQELTDVIYEWRTMNESPQVHERIPSDENTDKTILATLTAIGQNNADFDKVTRAAMRQLANGQTATAELEKAQQLLDKLGDLFESLPEPQSTAVYKTTTVEESDK